MPIHTPPPDGSLSGDYQDDVLSQGPEAIREWRKEHPTTRLNLIRCTLERIDLSKADLRDIDLRWATIRQCDISEADLTGARLSWTTFASTNVNGTNFTNATCWGTIFVDLDLSAAVGLDAIAHHGPSYIDIGTLQRSRHGVPHNFLRKAGISPSVITYLDPLSVEAIQFNSCFISFTDTDSEFAEKLYHDLISQDVRCFKWNHDARTGRDLWGEIDQGIRVNDRVVVILSDNSLRSPGVQREIERAIQKEDRLLSAQATGQRTDNADVLFPIRLDDTIFNWKHHRQPDVVRKTIKDASDWEMST